MTGCQPPGVRVSRFPSRQRRRTLGILQLYFLREKPLARTRVKRWLTRPTSFGKILPLAPSSENPYTCQPCAGFIFSLARSPCNNSEVPAHVFLPRYRAEHELGQLSARDRDQVAERRAGKCSIPRMRRQ
jgi:hypothetical protein